MVAASKSSGLPPATLPRFLDRHRNWHCQADVVLVVLEGSARLDLGVDHFRDLISERQHLTRRPSCPVVAILGFLDNVLVVGS